MKLHSRHEKVTKARLDVSKAVTVAVEKYGLTYAELFEILLEEAQGWNKYALRKERHPDAPDQPADLE